MPESKRGSRLVFFGRSPEQCAETSPSIGSADFYAAGNRLTPLYAVWFRSINLATPITPITSATNVTKENCRRPSANRQPRRCGRFQIVTKRNRANGRLVRGHGNGCRTVFREVNGIFRASGDWATVHLIDQRFDRPRGQTARSAARRQQRQASGGGALSHPANGSVRCWSSSRTHGRRSLNERAQRQLSGHVSDTTVKRLRRRRFQFTPLATKDRTVPRHARQGRPVSVWSTPGHHRGSNARRSWAHRGDNGSSTMRNSASPQTPGAAPASFQGPQPFFAAGHPAADGG